MASVACAGVAGAEEQGCTVTVTPSNSSAEWLASARVAEVRLRRAPHDGDCATLDIRVSADRAFVVFTTRDGRSTVRPLDTPDEIGPLVDALLVTIAESPRAPAAVAVAPPGPSSINAKPTEPAVLAPPQRLARVVLRGGGGGRVSLGFPSAFVSPSISAGAGVLVGPWELSVFGVSDPVHALLSRHVPGFTLSRYAVGVAFGRLLAVGGGTVDLGTSTSMAIAFEDATSATGSNGGQSNGEPMVGVYAGFSYPRRSMVRVRTELSTDLVVYRAPAIDPELPLLPLWSGTASIGAEWELP